MSKKNASAMEPGLEADLMYLINRQFEITIRRLNEKNFRVEAQYVIIDEDDDGKNEYRGDLALNAVDDTIPGAIANLVTVLKRFDDQKK